MMKHFFHNQRTNNQQGNALLIVMVLFVAISLSIAAGLVAPVLRANRVATNNLESKRSYFAAESGIEDVLYRLLTSKQVGSSEVLVLGSETATTTVTDISGGNKQIQTIGDAHSRNRSVTIVLTKGVGVSFNYGVQTGRGGVVMGNNAEVVGNIYANGNITGSGIITGTAVAANTAALTADQANDSPSTPTNSITFRQAAATQDFAQSFQVSTTSPINKVQVYIKKVGAPANVTVRLVTDAGGAPGTNNLLTTQATLSASLVTTSYGWTDIVFPSNPTLYPGTTYWLILDSATNSLTNYYSIGANDATYASGSPRVGVYGSSWSATVPTTLDAYFRVYLGGLTSGINGITVGSAGKGDAWAHTITNSTVAGVSYCQVGTGCNTSRSDPPPTDFPVSEANIASWKNTATSGGTISGNYTPPNGSTLGPKVITGNLVMNNGDTLTLTGTVWVQGNVVLSNNSTIKLSAAYGSGDEVLVSDGTININNNGNFKDSGTAGSYIMTLTTSDCPTSSSCGGVNAIDVSNNAGAVILNAQKGTIHLNNNAALIEATGETLKLDNNAVITYQSGLVDTNFSSGPGGSWNIKSWRETQ